MKERKLTPTQWLALGYMLNSGGVCYGSPKDRTMKALESRGLVAFYKRGRYSKNRWMIVDNPKAIEILSEERK